MILSDRSIAEALASGRLVIEPAGEDALQPAERPYGAPGLRSKYQGQTGPTPSRGYLDYEKAARGERPQ